MLLELLILVKISFALETNIIGWDMACYWHFYLRGLILA